MFICQLIISNDESGSIIITKCPPSINDVSLKHIRKRKMSCTWSSRMVENDTGFFEEVYGGNEEKEKNRNVEVKERF
uniref:Uncharacterized protein n=1 Tax=Caenorhabditis japonica TaxID=281687 RepID=A0A8R1EDY3_CAEJA